MLRRLALMFALGLSVSIAVGLPAVQAATGYADWAKVSSGDHHTCAIRGPGALYCWGTDATGQVGDGPANSGADAITPQPIAGSWKSVSAGGAHTCGIKASGKLFCWGRDNDGQVGNGDASDADVVEPLLIGVSLWKSVSAGDSHTCGITTDGELFCWGSDDGGSVGNGDANADADVLEPEQIGDDTDWRAVDSGGFHTCGIRDTDQVSCWGTDSSGQVGNGDESSADVKAPEHILGHWKSISSGKFHTCGIPTSGKLKCWGADGSGQVGNGGDVNLSDKWAAPQTIGSSKDWARVDAGNFHTCGVRGTGKLFCWGSNVDGQLGNDADDGAPVPAPLRIGDISTWKSVDGGNGHSCAIRDTGKLFCWGTDANGQLGNGDDGYQLAPRRI